MHSIFGRKSNQQLESHISNLLSVALSDGTLDSSEWNRIVKIARDRGITEEEVKQFYQNADSAKFVPPSAFEEKIRQIFELVEIMIADGQIEEEELAICRKLALKLNINPRIISDMLLRIPQLIAEGKRSESIIEEITRSNG